jgi:hypothetical protein
VPYGPPQLLKEGPKTSPPISTVKSATYQNPDELSDPRGMSMFGLGHHGHHGQNPPAYPPAGGGPQQPTFKIFCKADEGYCLTVRDGNVVLAPTNPRDHHQHWYKDMRFSSQVKDEEGCPAFALVNAATGLAIKHSLGQSHPVSLVLCFCF